MKKLTLCMAAFVAMAGLFAGCSSDSDGGLPITEANIVGKWYMKSSKTTGEPMVDYQHECPTSKDFQEVLSDHTITYVAHGSDCGINDTQTSDWTLSGNTFSIIYDFDPLEPEVYKIVNLTEDELTLKETYENDEGQTFTTIYYLTKN